jgi:aminopeptidase N
MTICMSNLSIQLAEAHRGIRVWSQILSTLSTVNSVFSEVPEISEGLRKFTLKLVTRAVEEIGWDFGPDEDLLTSQFRSLLITSAGGAGHGSTIAEAQRQFNLVVSGEDPNAIHPSLRLAVFEIVIENGGKEEYEAVKRWYSTTTTIDGKELALQSLGGVPSVDHAKDLLEFTFSSAVAIQDRNFVARSLGQNPKVRLAAWEYIKENWETKIFPELGGGISTLSDFFQGILNKFASFEVEKDVLGFFTDKDQKGFDRGVKVVLNTISAAARYKERDTVALKEWLTGQGYA